ncbi:MAG: AAA family ATPase [Nocardioides sp.]
MSRLLHLNGPPGIGKSTLARRYVDDHPGVLNCDIDVLRTLIGGWQADFAGAGALIRPAALAMITAYLRTGHDVVLPQMLIRLTELEKFELAADDARAEFVACMLTDTEASAVSRFYRRGESDSDIAWHQQVREIVEADGGEDALTACHRGLQELLASRPGTAVIRSTEGEIDATYRNLLETVG